MAASETHTVIAVTYHEKKTIQAKVHSDLNLIMKRENVNFQKTSRQSKLDIWC